MDDLSLSRLAIVVGAWAIVMVFVLGAVIEHPGSLLATLWAIAAVALPTGFTFLLLHSMGRRREV